MMKKLILILTLIFALALCFVACEELGDNSNEGQTINALLNGAPDTEEPTTEEPTSEDDNLYTVEDVSLISLSPEERKRELISGLQEYIISLNTEDEMAVRYHKEDIADMREAKQPLHVKFDSESYYYICGYYNATHEYGEFECDTLCCSEKYTWVKFDNPENILEYYEGKKFVVAFQINRALFVKNILSDSVSVPYVENFQIYEVSFSEGFNTNNEIAFDEEFIYLNKTQKDTVFISKYYEWDIIPCVELDGNVYISFLTGVDGIVSNTRDLQQEFGNYYAVLIDSMREYSVTKGSMVYYYGLFDIEEFSYKLLKYWKGLGL